MKNGLVIHKIDDNINSLARFEEELNHRSEKERNLILEYPIVYIHNWQDSDKYEVYIGETNDFIQRTKQHYSQISDPDSWQNQLMNHNAELYVIGHEHFNKSLTLDIENRLILYVMSVEKAYLHNAKTNPQRKYYPDELDSIFHTIWSELHRLNKKLFPSESQVRDSAIFKASPLHKLTDEQEEIKNNIIQRIYETLHAESEHQLIFVKGDTGTGKTVLMSSTFYDLCTREDESEPAPSCFLIVNHDEQITLYSQIMQKLGLVDKDSDIVCKPTHFINTHSPDKPVDVAFVDEAHLLLTQGSMSYRGENQLQDILDRAKVTVIMFDENQILTTEQYWESQILDKYWDLSIQQGNSFELKTQLRINAPEEVLDWIDSFTKDRQIRPLTSDLGNYEIRIFTDVTDMDKAIQEKAADEDHKLSRIIATYDWEYHDPSTTAKRLTKYWDVVINDWRKPWNRELNLDLDQATKKANRTLAWAEQPQTIDEVGSTFTIQGFDLNYAAVILGPSVKYRDGKVIFDPSCSYNNKATRNRTLSDGTRQKFGETLIQHEVRILMTRGVEGLYIYACDEELRNKLLETLTY